MRIFEREEMVVTQSPESELLIEPITGHIGAEVRGLDLTEQLEDAEVAAIRAALLRWKVLFFRAQHLSHGEQIVADRTRRPRIQRAPEAQSFRCPRRLVRACVPSAQS